MTVRVERLALRALLLDLDGARELIDMLDALREATRGNLAADDERLLLDAMKGDPTLYARGDWVDIAWELLGPVLEAWSVGDPRSIPTYEAGTWGPDEADELLAREGRKWRRI